MIYTGIINRCQMENAVENKLHKLKIWVTLNSVRTVLLEACGTFPDFATRFGFTLHTDCLVINDFIGRQCKIKYKEDIYSFVCYK